METFRQHCPACQAILELPTSAVGRTARCPACQHTFPATGPDDPGHSGVASGGTSAGMHSGDATAGGPASFTAPIAKGESTAATSFNPYATPSGSLLGTPEVVKGELNIRRAKADFVISNGWEIFSARWQPLVLAGLIYFIANIAVAMFAAVGGWLFALQNPERMLLFSALLGVPLSMLMYYFQLGIQRLTLRVSRGGQAGVTDAFASLSQFLRLVPLMLLMIGITTVCTVVGQQFQGNMMEPAFDPDSFFAGLGIQLAGGLLNAVVLLFTWPIMYLIVDDRPHAYSTGVTIATNNLLLGFLIWWIIQLVLQIVVVLTCGLGMIVTQPLLLTFAAIAYLVATSQPLSSPRYTPAPVPDYQTNPISKE
jgi:hypothetical protein